MEHVFSVNLGVKLLRELVMIPLISNVVEGQFNNDQFVKTDFN